MGNLSLTAITIDGRLTQPVAISPVAVINFWFDLCHEACDWPSPAGAGSAQLPVTQEVGLSKPVTERPVWKFDQAGLLDRLGKRVGNPGLP